MAVSKSVVEYSHPGVDFRAKRTVLGLTQAGLGRAVGLESVVISQWETGRASLEPEDLARLEWCIGQAGVATWVSDRLDARGITRADLIRVTGITDELLDTIIRRSDGTTPLQQICIAAVLGLTANDLGTLFIESQIPVALDSIPAGARVRIAAALGHAAFAPPRPEPEPPPDTPPALRPIGQGFRELRLGLDLSRTALGRAAGVPSLRIADHERRGSVLIADEQNRLLWCLGWPADGDWMRARLRSLELSPLDVSGLLAVPQSDLEDVLDGARSDGPLQIQLARLMGMHARERSSLMAAHRVVMAFRAKTIAGSLPI